ALAQEDPGLPLPRPRPSSAPPPSVVTTDFDVNRDALAFGNPGDSASPEGNCLGMSLVAIDRFERRRAAEAAGQPTAPARTPSRQLDDHPYLGDPSEQELT